MAEGAEETSVDASQGPGLMIPEPSSVGLRV